MKQNKELPKIALGAWAWGNDGTFGGSLTEEELRPVFDAAMEAGLNLWDTAYVYGMGASERVLGTFLRTVPRDSYLISDKFTPQCADPGAENAVTAMYETSAALLGTDYMDFYWIHNPVEAPEWTRKLIPLAKSGKIGRIGLSNHNLAEIKEAAAILEAEGLKISAIQNHYSLLNRSSETSGILDYCRENGIIFSFRKSICSEQACNNPCRYGGTQNKPRPAVNHHACRTPRLLHTVSAANHCAYRTPYLPHTAPAGEGIRTSSSGGRFSGLVIQSFGIQGCYSAVNGFTPSTASAGEMTALSWSISMS